MTKRTIFLRGMLAAALAFAMAGTACEHDGGSSIPGPGPQPGPSPSPTPPAPGPSSLTGTTWSYDPEDAPVPAYELDFWAAPDYGTVTLKMWAFGYYTTKQGTYLVSEDTATSVTFAITMDGFAPDGTVTGTGGDAELNWDYLTFQPGSFDP